MEVLLNKMRDVIDSATPKQKDVVERYLSLANVVLHKEWDDTKDWGILGASMGLKNRFESKFGNFSIQPNHITH